VPSRVSSWLTPAAWVAAVSAALLLLFPVGFPNYDTIYALVWGRELAHGMSPDYGAALPPTPHPLADLLGLVTTPLGGGAIDVTMALAYVSLALVGYLVYRLGALWFDRPIGAVAALVVLTRAPYLSNGLRAYVDLPYIALCLGALVIETKKPRADWPVLLLLALAGLLRPEAWLFSIAYLAYLLLAPSQASAIPDGTADPASSSRQDRSDGKARLSLERADTQSAGLIRPALVRARGNLASSNGIGLAVLALSAPLLWAIFDWITAGSPAYSFTGTQETVETLKRHTGPVDLVLWGPRALGEVMQWPGMVAALGGLLLGFAFLRRRSALGIAAVALVFGAFALLAVGGLAIIARYTMLGASLLAIFVALALLGWRLLEVDHPWRRRWQAFAGVVLLMFDRAPRPLQPGLDRARPDGPGRHRRLRRAALRPDRRPQPPCDPPPRLRPRREANRDRQRQRGRNPARRLLPQARQHLRHPQLHPRPQRPDPLLAVGTAGLQRSRPQRLLGPLPPLLTGPHTPGRV
jgi:hypothetical protein